MLSEIWESYKDPKFYVIVCPKLWVDDYILKYAPFFNSWWSQWKVIVASHHPSKFMMELKV
jgi:hypothetical protein